ncbi:hypothetical protein K490DRAFT_57236 [Saccharata proteae CBS 121410]|uniref:J domain-containing protein n=1 Tax=Saccharata proteae CBS 121410 TaxID=1314787 RepID=A0A9P4HSH4_9PEZI|nr:hypothetical protein K490DRAFT_57236 [Saccharata proteae CBS 121410]
MAVDDVLQPRTRPPSTAYRRYASIAGEPLSNDGGAAEFPWPENYHPHPFPTPYQIFSLKKGAPYSKRRFYELVKIYHPDRNNSDSDIRPSVCSHDVRTERYRLIVAAHTILSDPAKRTAYDRYGAGWGSAREINAPDIERASWKPGQDPTHNATWEDWERWYERDKKSDQHPIFASNGAFIACVAIGALCGIVGQATRAGNFSNSIIEQRDMVHSQSSQDLKKARQMAVSYNDREARIQSFLRHRDADTHAEEAYRRLLPAPEVCSSEGVSGR